MKTRSAKKKGKRLQNTVRNLLVEKYSEVLEPGDIKSTTMGESGIDVQLSPAARKVFPWGIECKNQEAISIWKCLKCIAPEQGSFGSFAIHSAPDAKWNSHNYTNESCE